MFNLRTLGLASLVTLSLFVISSESYAAKRASSPNFVNASYHCKTVEECIFKKHVTHKTIHKHTTTKTVHKYKKTKTVSTQTNKELPHTKSNIIGVASRYEGMSEVSNNGTLTKLFKTSLGAKVNPRRTPWCAVFVNSVLAKSGHKVSGSFTASSFRSYGKRTSSPVSGDIVVFRGHVGFFRGFVYRNGRKYVAVLGGNQSNKVQISYYPASKVLSYRKPI